MIELKPCPCCGKKPEIWPQEIELDNGKMIRRWFAVCTMCFISTRSYKTKKRVCAEWNMMKGKGEP